MKAIGKAKGAGWWGTYGMRESGFIPYLKRKWDNIYLMSLYRNNLWGAQRNRSRNC